METPQVPRFLVVDDNRQDMDETLQVIRTHCSSYEARVVEGAWEGLDYLFAMGRFHERQRYPLPDVVLLAANMAQIDGVEVLRRMAGNDSLRRIAVALLCNTVDEKRRALRQGVRAEGLLMKPISGDCLRDVLCGRKTA
jgi:two-component system response regulator